MDGLLIHAFDGFQEIEAFISRKVMDIWARQDEHPEERQSLYRRQYNAIGKYNLPAIARIVAAKYARGVAFNRQHPFVDVLTSDISESGARWIRNRWCALRFLHPLEKGGEHARAQRNSTWWCVASED
jgi:hypothetical protein